MMTWLLVIILAYLFFSLGSFGDKLILSGRPEPKSYTFFMASSSIFIVLFIPFVKFGLPSQSAIPWIIAEAVVFLLGLFLMYYALKYFDVSKVVTTIGGTQPVIIFALTWLFWGPQILARSDILAFILLIIGSILISYERKTKTVLLYLSITLLSSLFFSLEYVFAKIVFLQDPFMQSFIWMRVTLFILALLFLITKDNRKKIFSKKNILNKKTGTIFIFTAMFGATATVLQSFAVSLAPVAYLAVVNSLRGLQYVFLFFITIFFTVFFPRILKEKISKQILTQKAISIILIGTGLALLVLY